MPKKRSPTIRILRLLSQNRRRTVLFLIGLVLLAAGFDIAVPFISQKLIDALITFFKGGGGSPIVILLGSAIGILVATILNRLVSSTYNYQLFKTVTRAEDHVKHEAFGKYLRLHALFHHGSSSGQIIGRIERGATAIYVILYELFGENLLPPLATFLGILTALVFKNAWIALAVFLPLPIYLIAIQKLTKKIYEIEKRANDDFEAVARESYDVASNVLTVKKFSQEETEKGNQVKLQTKARRTQYSAERLWIVMENIQTFIATLGRISVILLAGFLVLKGKSTIGEFVLYITLQNMAYNPLARLSVTFPRLRRNLSRAERLFDILDEPIRVTDKKDAWVLPPLSREIKFEEVSFGYLKEGRVALKNISVTIPANTTVALVGRSGSGKTTFVNLLLRSFDPDKGRITIDGYDLKDVTQESLRGQIAVVPQEVDLFSRTISENIAYGKPEVTDEQITQAAKTALAHDFIMRMEEGYETVVGERGIKLSGGERQRVGIARAVLRDPRILILDEATSHLDTESERLIQRATDALIKNRTTIIIAHRLSTILGADMILVFSAGKIEAMGRHEEVLKSSPTYQRLHNLQFNET